jgi:hypothetical protein
MILLDNAHRLAAGGGGAAPWSALRAPVFSPYGPVRCHVPINYAALSPDGRHLVCVGDCHPTLIYEARPTGEQQSRVEGEGSVLI